MKVTYQKTADSRQVNKNNKKKKEKLLFWKA